MVKPADLENVEFSVSFRGYNGDQVDDYIDMVVKEYTELSNEYEKYKVLCERQNHQIKIMRERILELEAQAALPNETVAVPVTAEPETVVKTVVKTVVDTKATEEALCKAKALDKLMADFKAKALELYNAQLAELSALSFDYDPDAFTVEEAEAIEDFVEESDESVEQTPSDIVAEETEEPAIEDETTDTIEELKEEADEIVLEEAPAATEIEDEEVVEESPIVEEINEKEIEQTTETQEALEAKENDTDEPDVVDDDTILSADELGALFESSDDELNSIIDELSGLFAGKETAEAEPDKMELKAVKVNAPSDVVQQSFDSLFITSVDDGE